MGTSFIGGKGTTARPGVGRSLRSHERRKPLRTLSRLRMPWPRVCPRPCQRCCTAAAVVPWCAAPHDLTTPRPRPVGLRAAVCAAPQDLKTSRPQDRKTPRLCGSSTHCPHGTYRPRRGGARRDVCGTGARSKPQHSAQHWGQALRTARCALPRGPRAATPGLFPANCLQSRPPGRPGSVPPVTDRLVAAVRTRNAENRVLSSLDFSLY